MAKFKIEYIDEEVRYLEAVYMRISPDSPGAVELIDSKSLIRAIVALDSINGIYAEDTGLTPWFE